MNHIEILTQLEIKHLIAQYKKWEISNSSDHIIFCARHDDVTITIYKSNKVMWQGKNINRPTVKKAPERKTAQNYHNNANSELISISAIGSDEVGVGDYFGPLIACACFVPVKDIEELKSWGVKDSKLLSYDQIMKLAPRLIKSTKFAVAVLGNSEYNHLISTKWNGNELKTLLHIQVINKLINQKLSQDIVIIDKYSSIKMFQKYVQKVAEIKKINFKPKSLMYIEKAESKHIAVSAASIIARYYFLNLMNDMSKVLQIKIPLGASHRVDRIATLVKKKHGVKELQKYVKWHFANSRRI